MESVCLFGLVVRRMGSFSYTPRAGEYVLSFFSTGVSLTRLVMQSVSSLSGSGVSLIRPALEFVSSFVGWGISLTRPVLVCLVFGLFEFLLHSVMESVSTFSGWKVSLTRPVLETVWSFVGWGVYPTRLLL